MLSDPKEAEFAEKIKASGIQEYSDEYYRTLDQMMKALSHEQFTYELAQFNLECNLKPQVFGGKCLSSMETELVELLELARQTAHDQGGGILLSGILPTLRRSDLSLKSMVQNPRYLALNNAMAQLRGGDFDFSIRSQEYYHSSHVLGMDVNDSPSEFLGFP